MLLTIGKAAERIGVHVDTLRDWETNGPDFSRTAGGHRRYDEAELDRWKQSMRQPATTTA